MYFPHSTKDGEGQGIHKELAKRVAALLAAREDHARARARRRRPRLLRLRRRRIQRPVHRTGEG